jgi:uncharacterized membrane protein YbhN (UPF0104 family)
VTQRQLHRLSWFGGVLGLALVVWYLQPTDLLGTLRSVGIGGVLGWIALTLAARLALAEITVLPIHALGFPISRADAFWIGWIRTFSNQVFPFSGLAYYAHRIRKRSGISWTELAALSSPQLLLAATAIGLIGVVATAINFSTIGKAAFPSFIAFGVVASGSLLIAVRSAQVIEWFPKTAMAYLRGLAEPVGRLAKHPSLVRRLVTFHCVTILLRGGRLWILFAAAGVQLSWHEVLLVLAVAESSLLLQVTPGGLGVREGVIVGAAMLFQIAPEAAASVAVIDRLFTVAVTTIMATPAILQIHRKEVLP